MKSKSPSRSGKALWLAARLPGFACIACLLLCAGLLRAAQPPNPLVELGFSEGIGATTTANSGTLGGYAVLQLTDTYNDPDLTAGNEDPLGNPFITNNAPVGPYAPGNLYSVDNGNPTGASGDGSGTGGWQVILTNTPYLGGLTYQSAFVAGYPATNSGALGPASPDSPWPGLTVCGWVNCVNLADNTKWNRIAYALDAPGGGPQNGFELGHNSAGQINLSVNASIDDAPSSTGGGITQDPNGGTNNWVFIAATYDPSLASNNLCYYFGTANRLAYLDSTFSYLGGLTNSVITNTGCLYLGNFGNMDNSYEFLGGNSSRVFKGYMTEFKVYTNALTLDQIQQAQLNATVPATAPSILPGGQPASLTVPEGLPATFNVIASGSGQLQYTWKTNNVNVPGATNSSFTIASVQLGMNNLQVKVGITNGAGGVLSSNATLTVIPANPMLFSLSFSEGAQTHYTTNFGTSGTQVPTANCGVLGGVGMINWKKDGSGAGYPYLSSYVPVGPAAPIPAFNVGSLYMGLYYDTGGPGSCSSPTYTVQGNRWVDFNTNILSSTGLLPPISGLTICGWLNSGDTCFRSAASTYDCIVYGQNASFQGFRLTHNPSWALELAVNENNNTSDAQSSGSVGGSGLVPVDITLPPNNWVFFAVTYDGTLTANNVNYYFGNTTTLAALDSTSPLTYNKGTIPVSGPVTVGNVNSTGNGRTISGQNSPFFKGYIDELRIFDKVLTLAEIQQLQTGPALPPVLLLSDQANQATLNWANRSSSYVPTALLQIRGNLTSGSWANVPNVPTVSGGSNTVTLPFTNSAFFRLKSN